MNVPGEQWLPCSPDLTSGTLCRGPDILLRIVKQFDVENAARYQAQRDGNGKILRTWCNIFGGDVRGALGVSAPLHWWLAGELRANDLIGWLAQHAVNYGWRSVDEQGARTWASTGYPVVAAWFNPYGEGHEAIVLPSPADGPTMIAQAGATNFVSGPLERGFALYKPVFWSHA